MGKTKRKMTLKEIMEAFKQLPSNLLKISGSGNYNDQLADQLEKMGYDQSAYNKQRNRTPKK